MTEVSAPAPSGMAGLPTLTFEWIADRFQQHAARRRQRQGKPERKLRQHGAPVDRGTRVADSAVVMGSCCHKITRKSEIRNPKSESRIKSE